MLLLLLFEKISHKFYLDNDKSNENLSDFNSTTNTYHATLDKLIQTALSTGKQSILLNITSNSEEDQTDILIEEITTENNEQQISTTDKREYTEKRIEKKDEV